MRHCYDFPHPALTTDVVLFSLRETVLMLLLVKRRNEPFRGAWALPGGFVGSDESLDECALRELKEETGVSGVYLEQLFTFGRPDRDPRERVVSVAYYGLVPSENLSLRAASDAADAGWFAVDHLPALAFDHHEIVALARTRLTAKLDYSTIALQFLPRRFTLSTLQAVYETIRGEALDKRNFRKWALTRGHIEPTGQMDRNGNHRPAMLYRARHPDRVEFIR
jgi:8-oxo-dGTP diphosphatase